MNAVLIILSVLTVGSLAYFFLLMVGVRNYLRVPPLRRPSREGVSIFKPLYGCEDELEENLRSFFQQDYPKFEILIAVRKESAPETAIARSVMEEFPGVPARLFVTGESPHPNGKVFALDAMLPHARHDVLVMADSDIRVTSGLVRMLAAEMHDAAIQLVTCPYRAAAGDSVWSRMEAIGMNTELLGGVLVARLLDGMKFALGCTLAIRREALEAIGGFGTLRNYLAEDFAMGQLVAGIGGGVVLSSFVIEHRIGAQKFWPNMRHRLRWARSTRRSRRWGYVGQVFTNPLPLAALLLVLRPEWWPLCAAVLCLRIAVAWATTGAVLKGGLGVADWCLLPVQDFASFAIWIWGFFGNTIEWRGRLLTVLRDGKFETEAEDEIQTGRVEPAAQGGGRRRRRRAAGAAASRR